MRDVVVTGMGAVSPYGAGAETLWASVREGISGIDWLTSMPTEGMPIRFGGELKDFDHKKHLQRHSGLRRDRGLQMGLVAAAEALHQARLLGGDEQVPENQTVAAIVGSGLGPNAEVEAATENFFVRGWKAMRPTTVPCSMHNALSGNLSVYFKLRGASYVVAAACTSGALAIGQAYHAVATGMEDMVLCGGADSPFTPAVFAGWTQLGVLASHSDPCRASRPFDKARNGVVLGEGAGMMVVESLESARLRGARPLARLIGFGVSSDGQHITSPQVAGQVHAMRRCLKSAGLGPHEVDYINAHGTGTPQNDRTEAEAIHTVFGAAGTRMPVSSTKSVLGHAMGASGAIELVTCVQVLRHGFVPPTANCDEPDPDFGLDYVQNRGRSHSLRRVLSNSFGFGGSNCCLLLERCDD